MNLNEIGYQYDSGLHKRLSKGEKCFFPGCNAPIQSLINSHTIQRRGSLSSIAENGHVYRYIGSVQSMDEYTKYGYIPPKKVGIAKVSIIPAFCKYHDNQLFYVIENQKIVPTPEQICIFTLRALTYEIFLKESVTDATRNTQDFAVKHLVNNYDELSIKYAYQERSDTLIYGWEIAKKELLQDYNKLSRMITKHEYEDYSYLLFRCNQMPQIQCTGYFNPSYDFDGILIQDLSQENIKTENISVSIFSNEGNGYILFTWPSKSVLLKHYIVSLLNQKNLSNVIVSMVFSCFENHAFNISWWESLSHIKKRDLCDKAFRVGDTGYSEQLGVYPLSFCTHLKYVEWELVAKTNSKAVTKKLEEFNFQSY